MNRDVSARDAGCSLCGVAHTDIYNISRRKLVDSEVYSNGIEKQIFDVVR